MQLAERMNAGRAAMGIEGASAPVCGRLRSMFDTFAADPLPDTLTKLIDELDDAFSRGDLKNRTASPTRRR